MSCQTWVKYFRFELSRSWVTCIVTRNWRNLSRNWLKRQWYLSHRWVVSTVGSNQEIAVFTKDKLNETFQHSESDADRSVDYIVLYMIPGQECLYWIILHKITLLTRSHVGKIHNWAADGRDFLNRSVHLSRQRPIAVFMRVKLRRSFWKYRRVFRRPVAWLFIAQISLRAIDVILCI